MRLLRVSIAALFAAATLTLAVQTVTPHAARLSAELIAALRTADGDPMAVFVHAADVDAAATAAAESGLDVISRFDRVGVVAAFGPGHAVRSVAAKPSVSYVEADRPVELFMETSHVATRGEQARQGFVYDYAERQPDGTTVTRTGSSPGVDGSGISIAIVDSGIDGTHPMFQAGGRSKVVRNLRIACPLTSPECHGVIGDAPDELFVDAPNNNSEVTLVGHGTHVAGTAAGADVTTTDGRRLSGAAPGAALVGLSVGASASVLGYVNALNWVLEHHRAPCGADVAGCPPIRVVNNSYGSAGSFSEQSTVAKIQRALIADGIVMVWAAGNDGGDGTYNASNSLGQDPTPGSIMVANYWDHDNGSGEGELDSSSSRGSFGRLETYPDLSAPGANIVSACRPGYALCQILPIGKDVDVGGDPNYAAAYGTSMAAPHVAGIVAQLLQARPDLTPAEVENILEDTAHPFPFGGRYEADPTNTDHAFSYDKGHGLVDATNAVVVARQLQGWPDGEISCVASAPISRDPAGDAKGAGFITTGSHDSFVQSSAVGSEPKLDLLETRAAFDGDALSFDVHISDLRDVEPAGATGTVIDLTFGRGATDYRVRATRDLGDATAQLFDQDGTAVGEELPVTFDPAADVISVAIPGALLAEAGVAPWRTGEIVVVRDIASRRLEGRLLSMSDGAGPYCAYQLGSGAATEAPPGGNLGKDPVVPVPPTQSAEASVGVGGSYSWEAGPFTHAAAVTTVDGVIFDCEGGVRVGDACDERFVELRVPAGGATLTVTITPGTMASDFDLYVYGPDGKEVGYSAGLPIVDDPEGAERVVVAVTVAGVYRIAVNPFTALNDTYHGELTVA